VRIVFLGTPDFSVPLLRALVAARFEVVAVVTAPDKPAGRGLQMKSTPVKECAIELGIPVLQPEKLKDPSFIESLRAYRADIQVVVAFRMLPEVIWSMPPMGTWNLHASLLPHYRGAAPINHAIIQGEAITGLSTFKLVHAIDEGAIALQLPMPINPRETAGSLHDRMSEAGAMLMLTTLKAIEANNIQLIEQLKLGSHEPFKQAPKLNPEFCKIDWTQSTRQIDCFIRGLSPFPGAHTTLHNGETSSGLKIYLAKPVEHESMTRVEPGTIEIIGASKALVKTADGWLELESVQLAGKKRMETELFLRGLRVAGSLFCA
jgi:methionyl-tRNA formyltransferase